jgi:hypothetical protein
MAQNTGFIDSSVSKPTIEFAKYVQKNPGPYVGQVINNRDPSRMGRLSVNIPSITGQELGSQSQEIVCRYMTPFWGTKTPRYLSEDNANSYDGSQHSYGMWMVPPDIGTKVMVIFVEGDANQAYWMGCIPEPFVNHMTPGIGASTNTGVATTGGDFDQNKQQLYGTDNVPAGEVNRQILSKSSGSIKQPIHPFAETLRQQGLIQDTVRGTTSSSARRESPSQVYGISTPGRKNPASKSLPLGGTDSSFKDIVDRLTGQTLVLDDGDEAGDNQLIRLRSASGHQILLNDSAGVVYIANGSGNAWMEFAANGSIDVYSGGSVSVRTRGDMNFHSDANINMFSQNDIRMSAAGKLILDGGFIQQHSDSHIQMQATEGSIMAKAPIGNYIVDVGTNILQQSKGAQHLIGQQIHFNSSPYINNLLDTFGRTSIQDPSGTGTQREIIPDVSPVAKYLSGPLQVYPQGNVSMSGMRVPTHEPYPYHFDQIVQFVGLDPSLNDNIPGTPEFIANRNRTSSNPTIRVGQFQADLQRYMEKQGLTLPTAVNKVTNAVKGAVNDAINQSTGGSIEKIQKLADEFTRTYNQTYNLKDLGPLKLSPITTGITSAVEQTVEAYAGKAVNFLKDQVFVNTNGALFSASNLGKQVTGAVNKTLGDLTGKDNVTGSVSDYIFGKQIQDLDTGEIFRQGGLLDSLGTQGIIAGAGQIPKIPGLNNLEIANINLGQTGTLDLGKLSANLEKGITSSISNIANSQINTIIGRSGTLTKAAGVVGDLSSINDQTGGLLGKAAENILLGEKLGPGGGTYIGGIFGLGGPGDNALRGIAGGLTGVTDKVKNFMGGKPISVNSVTNVFSNFGTQLSTKIASAGAAIGSAFKSFFSDVRLKNDVELLGAYKDVNIYRYKYVWDKDTTYVGVMAQELLESKYKDVVEMDSTGYYKVNYAKLSERIKW